MGRVGGSPINPACKRRRDRYLDVMSGLGQPLARQVPSHQIASGGAHLFEAEPAGNQRLFLTHREASTAIGSRIRSRPLEISKRRSQLSSVLRRWANMKVVRPIIRRCSASRIAPSVRTSTELV